MSRCLCCNKELAGASAYELKTGWHTKCIRRFFGTAQIPELDCSESDLEKLANTTVSKGLTVPGVQKKLSLHLETVDQTARLTIVDYPTGYILKPQSKEFPCLPEAEYLVMKMAEKAKIKTVPNALISMHGEYAYITKRIDRDHDRLYAMEDFCQLSNRVTADKYKGSYENCGRIIRKYSRNVGLDNTDLFYRLLFCFVTGNSDMHLKNFSLIEDEPASRTFLLSPAYDLLPVNIIMPSDKEQMALTVNGKKRNIRKKDFKALADSLGIPEKAASGLVTQILRCKETFLSEIRNSYLPENMKADFQQLVEERSGCLI